MVTKTKAIANYFCEDSAIWEKILDEGQYWKNFYTLADENIKCKRILGSLTVKIVHSIKCIQKFQDPR